MYEFIRKLPTPEEIKEQFPVSPELIALKKQRDAEIRDVFTGKSNKFLLIIGPCSADNEIAVCAAGPLRNALRWPHRRAGRKHKASFPDKAFHPLQSDRFLPWHESAFFSWQSGRLRSQASFRGLAGKQCPCSLHRWSVVYWGRFWE